MTEQFWKDHAKRAEDHAAALAEQCEALQVENDRLEHRVEELTDHDNMWKHAQDMGYGKVIDELKEDLRAAYDLLEESLAPVRSCEFAAMASLYLKKKRKELEET